MDANVRNVVRVHKKGLKKGVKYIKKNNILNWRMDNLENNVEKSPYDGDESRLGD